MKDGDRFCGWDDTMLLQEQAKHSGGVSKWNKRHLKTFIAKTIPGIERQIQVDLMMRAMKAVSDVCNVTFEVTDVKSQADLYEMSSRIDGRSGTLAWHELPNGSDNQLDGKIDSSERWDYDKSDGVDGISLFAVWLHELGHGMGLPHAPRGSNALMEAFYSSRILSLQNWDITQLVNRYGEPIATPVPNPPNPNPNPDVPVISIIIDLPKNIMPGPYKGKISSAS